MRRLIQDFRVRLAVVTVLLAAVLLLGEVLLSSGWLEGGNVILNEVCCYNDSIVYDKMGEYNDYIELYNPTSHAIDLGGYGLSDQKSNLMRYRFPENSILESGEYMILWSGEGPLNEWAEEDLAFYLRFSLKAGETVYLSNASEQVIDKVKIPNDIERDVSYSRRPDTAVHIDEWIVAEGTPGTANAEKVQEPEQQLDAAVAFSVDSGFYEGPFQLEMSVDGDCEIYYTLDGSDPTTDSFRYDGPIRIEDSSGQPNRYAGIEDISLIEDVYVPTQPVEKANVIRAVAIDAEGRKGPEHSAVYFIGYQEKYGFQDIAVISLTTDPDNLFGAEKGIYTTGNVWEINKERTEEFRQKEAEWMFFVPANYSRRGKGWQRETSMKYFDREGNLIHEQQIGLRVRGGVWSSACNQKSFNMLALPEADGKQYVCEGMFGRKETSLMLRTGASRDLYATNIRDVLNQSLVADRNVGTQAFEPCQVFLNGEYWGLYNLQERMDTSYFASHYGVEEENIIIYKNDWIRVGDWREQDLYLDMVDFAVNHDLSQDEYYEQILREMDIQSYIDYYCFEVYVANCDSVGNNTGLWRVRETGSGPYEDGRWRFFIFDTDDSAGMIPGHTDAATDSFKEGNWQRNILGDPLFTALLQNERFKEQFVVTFMDMANYHFDTERVNDRIDELTAQYREAAVASHRRFQDADAGEDDYEEAVSVLKDFYENRYDYITAYLKTDFSLRGELTDVEIEHAEINGGAFRLNTLTIDGGEDFSGDRKSVV